GANTPIQLYASNPGKPDSATVGTLGSWDERAPEVTARGFSFPDAKCGPRRLSVIAQYCTWSASSAWIAGAPPLNARCTAFSPERRLISSPTRKESVPGPGEEKLRRPGCAFAAAMNSRSVDPLTDGFAPTKSGKRASCVTGAKSRKVS